MQKQLVVEDAKIHTWNRKLQSAIDNIEKTQRVLGAKLRQLQLKMDGTRQLRIEQEIVKKRKAESKALEAFDKIWNQRDSLTHIGSGRVHLLDPGYDSVN
jgi:hypothetical protein